jgi:hypothetical protein
MALGQSPLTPFFCPDHHLLVRAEWLSGEIDIVDCDVGMTERWVLCRNTANLSPIVLFRVACEQLRMPTPGGRRGIAVSVCTMATGSRAVCGIREVGELQLRRSRLQQGDRTRPPVQSRAGASISFFHPRISLKKLSKSRTRLRADACLAIDPWKRNERFPPQLNEGGDSSRAHRLVARNSPISIDRSSTRSARFCPMPLGPGAALVIGFVPKKLFLRCIAFAARDAEFPPSLVGFLPARHVVRRRPASHNLRRGLRFRLTATGRPG